MARSIAATLVVGLVVVLSVLSLAQSQAVLRAINGASKSLEWTSTTGGDLSFSHNTKNYLTFLSANNNNADFPQGVVVGETEGEVTGSLRLRTSPDGTSDIEGYVRGRWLSLSNDDPKNLFANGFEITRVASDYLTSGIPIVDQQSDVVSAQMIPVTSASGVVDGTQAFAFVTLADRTGADNVRFPTYAYRCDLLDCSKIVGSISGVVTTGVPSITTSAVSGYNYIIGTATATNNLEIKSLKLDSATAPLTAVVQTITIANPANPAATVNLAGFAKDLARNPVSAQIANTPTTPTSTRLHVVYHQARPATYYGDATNTLLKCKGALTIPAANLKTVTFAPGATEFDVVAPNVLGTAQNIIIGKNGYIRYNTGILATSFVAGNNAVTGIEGAAALNAIALWTAGPTPLTGGTITYGAVDATTFVVSFNGLTYGTAGNPAAVTGQIIYDLNYGFRIEIASANNPPAGTTVSQGYFNMGVTAGGLAGRYLSTAQPTGAVGAAQTNTCYHFIRSSYVYLTCPTNAGGALGTCDRLPFGIDAVPVMRNTINNPTGTLDNSNIALHSLDVDPANNGRFVFSAINCSPTANTNFRTNVVCGAFAGRSLSAWTFSGTAGSAYTPVATPFTIDLGVGENLSAGANSLGAADFDAEFSAAGTWMAVVGLQGSALEQFHWSYRTLSFATFPTTTYIFTTARLLATSIDLDSTGESLPFGAARIVRKAAVNYATLLIGNVDYSTKRALYNAGTPVIFRSTDDTWKQAYATFPNSYHAINSGGVVVWPHIATDDVSVLSYPEWRGQALGTNQVTSLPMLTRYTNTFLSPNAQECNLANAGKFYSTSSRVYACVEILTQDAIWTRTGVFTWAPVGVFDIRRQFSRPNNRAPCP